MMRPPPVVMRPPRIMTDLRDGGWCARRPRCAGGGARASSVAIASALAAVMALVLAAMPTIAQQPRSQLQGADALAAIYGRILDADFDTAAQQLATCAGIPREACLVLDANRIFWRIQLDPESTALDASFSKVVEEAISRSEAWAAREPKRAEAWFYVGGAYGARSQWRVLRLERLAAARDGKRIKESLERALQLDPTLDEAQLGIGLYQYYADIAPAVAKILRVLLFLPGGDKVEGLKRMLRARERGRLMRGEADFQLHVIYLWYERDFRKALDYLRGLDRTYPRNPLFLQSIAEVYDQYVHDRTESLVQYRALLGRAVRREVHEPALAEARARLGIATQLDALEQTDMAVDELNTVVSSNAPAPYAAVSYAWWRLALAHERMGRHDQAVRAFATAIARVPAGDASDLASRIRASQQRTRVDPVDGEVRRLSIEGARLHDRRDDDRAREVLDRALALRPTDVPTLYRRGVVARATGDLARATAWFDRACSASPSAHPTFVADACIARAEIALDARDLRTARLMFERAASTFGAHEVRRNDALRRARAIVDAPAR